MNTEKQKDNLDYLHIQQVKHQEAGKPRISLEQVKQDMGISISQLEAGQALPLQDVIQMICKKYE